MPGQRSPWTVDVVPADVIERLASRHSPSEEAIQLGVDIVGDPHREDDDGFNWSRLHAARSVTDIVRGSAVVLGSPIGTYLARVVAWDFKVSDDDPIVVLELIPLALDSVARALGRQGPS